jgi:predicted phosphoribosyltransferase
VLGITDEAFEKLASYERTEVERREQLYREGLPALNLAGQCAILVDDGIATGATMLAALRAARKAGAASVVVAVPVASTEAAASLKAEADSIVILMVPRFLMAIGQFYDDFSQLADEEVKSLLETARKEKR